MDEALRAVADGTRRAILVLVRDGERSAGDIAGRFPEISRPAVSQHLRVLADAGLVHVRRDGNRRMYALRPEGLAEAAGFVDRMWSRQLGRLKAAAESEERGDVNDAAIEQTVRIEARPPTVWRFFTDPERLAQWWGSAAADARPGGVLRVAMQDGPRPVMSGEFVELVPYERLVFTFGWEPAPGVPDIPPGGSRVEVTLVEDGDGTVVTLRHRGLPATLRGETTEGWRIFLGRLADEAAADHSG